MIHLAAAADDLEFETHAAHFPQPLNENTGGGRAMISKQVVQFAPLADNPSAPPVARTLARSLGFNSMIIAPMIRGDTVIGAIGTSRREPKAFDDRQIALIKTFADQAVIAIENARLFEEVQARTRELAKTVEDLEIANQRRWRGCGRTFPVRRPLSDFVVPPGRWRPTQHKSQFLANMSHELRTPLAAILGDAELMQEGFYEPQGPKSLDALTRIRSSR
jgi:signal transduction histidine kinase